jgi:hypothetical protein
MSNLIDYARKELEDAKLFSKEGDFYGGMTGKSVMELIECFSKQGHSGMSASIVRGLFAKLSDFEPINPLTFNDQDWEEVGNGKFQHKRYSAVFKEGRKGKPYFIDAVIWKDGNGWCFTGTREGVTSRQFVKIPFTPKKFYVAVKGDKIIDKKALKDALAYYDGQP